MTTTMMSCSKAAALVALLLASCTQVGPTYERPATDADDAVFVRGDNPAAASLDRWWLAFEDATLNDLVETALNHNLDLEIVGANLLEAEALLRSAHGARLPTLGATFGATRSTAPGGNGPFASGNRTYATAFEPGLVVGWEADLFGQLRRSERAAFAEVLASANDRDAVVHATVAAVARARIVISTTLRRIALFDDLIRSRTDTLSIVERRFDRGLRNTSSLDVYSARENLSAARANHTALLRELELAHNALSVLLGRAPSENVGGITPLGLVPPQPLPSEGTPLALLDRRPDLRASELRLAAANERIGIALADLYPSLRLSAAAAWSEDELSDLFNINEVFANIAGDLFWRLYEGGRLDAAVDVAEARFAALTADYRQRVLRAMRDVGDALVAERRTSERVAQLETRTEAARIAESLARERYAKGLESVLFVLESERLRQVAEDLLILERGALWTSHVDLALALGGSWIDDSVEPNAESEGAP